MDTPLLPVLPGYEDPQLIAHGTTALVYRAIQTRLNRPVAIKVITVENGTGIIPVNPEREVATTVALSSQPHIVSIIDTGVTQDGRRYIVMEYAEGGSYAQILRQRGPLPVPDVVEVGIKIGQALHAAHQAGIVHRDVKPSNILRSKFGPALTDFGIARAPDELAGTMTREMMTPHHASPEALLHQAQSGPSDIYSLASTMWTLLVGHPPFADPTSPDLDLYTFRDRVLHDPLPPMPRPDVPGWLITELQRAMAKQPAHRHATALEFSEALQRGSLGFPSSDGPTAGRRPPAATPQVHVSGLPADAWPVSVPTIEEPAVRPSARASVAPPAPPTAPPPVAPPATAPPPAAPPPSTVPPVAAPPVAPPPVPTPAVAVASVPPPAPPAPPPPAPPAPAPPIPAQGRAEVRHDSFEYFEGAVPPAPPLPPFEVLGSTGRGSTGLGASGRHASTAPEVSTYPEAAEPDRGGGHRGTIVTLLVFAVILAIAAGWLLYVRFGGLPGGDVVAPPEPTAAGGPAAPTDLHIEADRGTSITIAWTDPTGGYSYFAVLYPPDRTQAISHTVRPDGFPQRSATFDELDPTVQYCFRVALVLSVNDTPSTPDVCTTDPRPTA